MNFLNGHLKSKECSLVRHTGNVPEAQAAGHQRPPGGGGGSGGDVLSPSGVSGTSAYRAAHSGGLKDHVPALSNAGQ